MIRRRIAVLILVCCLMLGAWFIPNSQAAVFSPTINPSLWETLSDWMTHPSEMLVEKILKLALTLPLTPIDWDEQEVAAQAGKQKGQKVSKEKPPTAITH